MTNVDQWADVKPGDKITVTIEVTVASIEHFASVHEGDVIPHPFTTITYSVGEPHERPTAYGSGLYSDIFTIEIPDDNSPDVTVEVSRDSQPEPPEICPGTHAALDRLTIRPDASAS